MESHGTHLGQNHDSQSRTNESQFKKKMSPKLKKTIEINIQSFYFKAQQGLKEICIVKQQP